MKRYRIRVSGRVQGVGFRYAASTEARRLGLKGWVRNEADGSVLCLIQGEEQACRSYISWCRKGSGYSWVEKMDLSELPANGDSGEELTPFRIVY